MPSDALLQLAPQVTKTATFRHTATALSLPTGTPRRGNIARIIYSAAANASGANSVQFSIGISYDNASTWIDEFWSDPIALNTTAKSGEIYLLYRVVASSPPSSTGYLVALSVNITGAGASPTISYICDPVPGGPN